MSRRVLCKFFVRGACLKEEYCGYSHEWKVTPNNICIFYQKGICAYGSRCKYAHIEVPRLQSSALSASTSLPLAHEIPGSGGFELGESSGRYDAPSNDNNNDDVNCIDPANQSPSIVPANVGCPLGGKCPLIHGDLCPNASMEVREKRQKRIEALKLSEDIECSICFEHILSKSKAEERKFGILSDCDHPFCILCIRKWRKSSQRLTSADNSPSRTCPMCRTPSYFVIPSGVWYATREEKMQIIDSYKAKLRSIDCKHYKFGNGTCKFRADCFYKHTPRHRPSSWNAASVRDMHTPRLISLNFSRLYFHRNFNDPNPPIDYEDPENVCKGHFEEVAICRLAADYGTTFNVKKEVFALFTPTNYYIALSRHLCDIMHRDGLSIYSKYTLLILVLTGLLASLKICMSCGP